jgi:hypothetical protein
MAARPRVCELRCGGLNEPLARYHVSLGISLSLPLLPLSLEDSAAKCGKVASRKPCEYHYH